VPPNACPQEHQDKKGIYGLENVLSENGLLKKLSR